MNILNIILYPVFWLYAKIQYYRYMKQIEEEVLSILTDIEDNE